VDGGQLRQVFDNLLKNAVEAMPGGGRIRARLFVVGNRLFQLFALGPADKPVSPDSDRFFRSFRLVGN
jgi:signal transduction histidine kinase